MVEGLWRPCRGCRHPPRFWVSDGAAEEAGLIVGDSVLAVNGTDVTSIPHSEAANLARQGRLHQPDVIRGTSTDGGLLKYDFIDVAGPDLLTLTIGSDIARYPSSPRPACRGYLYKRTQSGLIKGWRKRWFVLTHECCLCYYRHRRVSSSTSTSLPKEPHAKRLLMLTGRRQAEASACSQARGG